jgi:hypothetical protein
MGTALVGFDVRRYARPESISKRAPSTTRTSLRVFSIGRLRASGSARKPELCQKLCQTSQCAAITYGRFAAIRRARNDSKHMPPGVNRTLECSFNERTCVKV